MQLKQEIMHPDVVMDNFLRLIDESTVKGITYYTVFMIIYVMHKESIFNVFLYGQWMRCYSCQIHVILSVTSPPSSISALV